MQAGAGWSAPAASSLLILAALSSTLATSPVQLTTGITKLVHHYTNVVNLRLERAYTTCSMFPPFDVLSTSIRLIFLFLTTAVAFAVHEFKFCLHVICYMLIIVLSSIEYIGDCPKSAIRPNIFLER